MQSKATLRYLRIAPRKVRLVADLLRGKQVAEARLILRGATKSAAEPLQKTLHSAITAAKNNFELEEDNLYISKVVVNEGPKLKRYRPRARGRAYPIQKKTSHITFVLEEIIPGESSRQSEVKKTEAAPGAQTKTRAESRKKQLAGGTKFRPEKQEKNQGRKDAAKRIFRRKAV